MAFHQTATNALRLQAEPYEGIAEAFWSNQAKMPSAQGSILYSSTHPVA